MTEKEMLNKIINENIDRMFDEKLNEGLGNFFRGAVDAGKKILGLGAKHADDAAKHVDDAAKHADDVAKHADDVAKSGAKKIRSMEQIETVIKNGSTMSSRTYSTYAKEMAEHYNKAKKAADKASKNLSSMQKKLATFERMQTEMAKKGKKAGMKLEEFPKAEQKIWDSMVKECGGDATKVVTTYNSIIADLSKKATEKSTKLTEIEGKLTKMGDITTVGNKGQQATVNVLSDVQARAANLTNKTAKGSGRTAKATSTSTKAIENGAETSTKAIENGAETSTKAIVDTEKAAGSTFGKVAKGTAIGAGVGAGAVVASDQISGRMPASAENNYEGGNYNNNLKQAGVPMQISESLDRIISKNIDKVLNEKREKPKKSEKKVIKESKETVNKQFFDLYNRINGDLF